LEENQEPTVEPNTEQVMKANLTEFLGNYADAIHQLKPTDWISVVADFDSGERLDTPIMRLHARVAKGTISEFRKTNGDLQVFGKEIQFVTQKVQGEVDRDLEILSSIFETALKQTYLKGMDIPGNVQVQGLYFDTFGALFFLDANLELLVYFPPLSEVRGGTVLSKEKLRSEQVERFKEELIELLKDYGQSLRALKPGDTVAIAIDLGPSDKGPGKLLLRVRKSDIEAASKERISFEEFKRRVEVREY
jgi:tRNA (Thr-GGU) A37 N-methylase